ncbi:MAG: NUDIX domain-containing protein [Candidatus Moranbacteria bacterium]|nr:NUDIX domain-containing protein [Candidatus Moranbacteria bacterium]
MNDIRETIAKIICDIVPVDEIERNHRKDALEWIASGAEIFRVAKPDIPPKHLISYFAVVDVKRSSLLLVDHIKAELWLPAGGHVEPGEHPGTTVERESMEELGLESNFIFDVPCLITQMTTVGKTAGHTDVSLWYVIKGNANDPIEYEKREFNGVRWFSFDEILDSDIAPFDPHMHRFVSKLKTLL